MGLRIKKSSHHSSRNQSPKEKQKKMILASILVVFLFAVIGVGASVLDGRLSLRGILGDNFSEEEEDVDDNYLTFDDVDYKTDNRFDTLLFMGTDYSGNEDATGDEYEGSLCDFVLLMIIDHTENTYAFLPLDRNTIVEVPLILKDGSGHALADEQLCLAHGYGGSKEMSCENVVTTVSNYLGGLSIDGYYALSISEIPAINHALGGVEVTLEDDFTDQDKKMKKGKTLTLTDKQAEIYLRSRMSMDDDTNVNRMSRQRTYMSSALKKVKASLKEDPEYINKLSDTFESSATSSIKGKQTSRAANAFAEYEDLGTFEIQGETRLGNILGDGEEHEEFYPDPDSVLKVMTELYHLEEVEEE